VLAIVLVIGQGSATPGATQKRKPAAKPAPQLKTPPPPATPYTQGYQKAYDEGFRQGEADWSANAPRDFRRSAGWQQRDSGTSEEFTKGYELGFELGYSDGYYGRARNAVVPRNAEVLAKAAALADRQREQREQRDRRGRDTGSRDNTQRDSDQRDSGLRDPGRSRTMGPLNVPPGTELRIRLSTPISTKDGRVGDTFKATVVSPSTYEMGTVEGHISTLNKSGRVSGKTEVALAFDTLTMDDGRSTRIDADLVKVYETETVKKVDEEGRIETGSRTKDSEVRGGVGAVAGAVIGGIVGGGKGAVIGAILGGAAGVGSIYVERNKDLILDPGTEMVIKTAGSRSR
jgi:outer membrane lipoprotein SlyB